MLRDTWVLGLEHKALKIYYQFFLINYSVVLNFVGSNRTHGINGIECVAVMCDLLAVAKPGRSCLQKMFHVSYCCAAIWFSVCLKMQDNKWDRMCGSNVRSLAVGKTGRSCLQTNVGFKYTRLIFVQHSDCAVSQRYGVISLVISRAPLMHHLTNNVAHALSCIFKCNIHSKW
jgi:hypothetical protein